MQESKTGRVIASTDPREFLVADEDAMAILANCTTRLFLTGSEPAVPEGPQE